MPDRSSLRHTSRPSTRNRWTSSGGESSPSSNASDRNLNRLVVTARTALPDARPIFFEAHFEAIDTESMDILGRGELTIKQRLRSESQSPRRDRSHRPPRCQTDLL